MSKRTVANSVINERCLTAVEYNNKASPAKAVP